MSKRDDDPAFGVVFLLYSVLVTVFVIGLLIGQALGWWW